MGAVPGIDNRGALRGRDEYVWFIAHRDGQVSRFTGYSLPGQPA